MLVIYIFFFLKPRQEIEILLNTLFLPIIMRGLLADFKRLIALSISESSGSICNNFGNLLKKCIYFLIEMIMVLIDVISLFAN